MKQNATLFAHIPEDEYKRLIEIEEKYYDLLAEREDISEYKNALEKLRVGEIVVDTRYLKHKKVGLYSIDSWKEINMFAWALVGSDALNESIKRLREAEDKYGINSLFNRLRWN